MNNEIINNVYNDAMQYVSDNNGYSSKDLLKTELYKNIKEFNKKMLLLNGKRVEITYTRQADWTETGGKKIGRIRVNEKKQIMFFEGKCRRKFFWLDAGLHNGFYATLIPQRIRILN